MFDQTFVDGVGKTNKSWTVAVSAMLQSVGVLILILIPLVFTDVLPQAQLTSMLVAPPPPPPPPPPPAEKKGCGGMILIAATTALAAGACLVASILSGRF